MAYNGNSDYFAKWNGFGGYHQVQPPSRTIRCGVPPVYGSFHESYGFAGRAPVAHMTPNHHQIQGFSMSERYPMTNPRTGHHAIPDTTTASASNSRSDTQNSPISTSSSRYVEEGPTNGV